MDPFAVVCFLMFLGKGGGFARPSVSAQQAVQQLRFSLRDDKAEALVFSELDKRGSYSRFISEGNRLDVFWRPNSPSNAVFNWNLPGVKLKQRRTGSQ